jgi:hypothetical protein
MNEQMESIARQIDETFDQLVSKEKKDKKKKLGSERGIETMFRSSYQVQMALTALADNKANMMISINGIIISIIFAAVAPRLETASWLVIPTAVLLVGTLTSIVFSILAARPRTMSGRKERTALRHDLLFFGDSSNISEDEFLSEILGLMEAPTQMYEAMIRNIYGLGTVLSKKFALLQVAYASFMAALVLSVLSLVVALAWI